MTTRTTLEAAIAGAALTLAVAAQAEAASDFGTLAGIETEPMNAAEMEATQGKNVAFSCVGASCIGSLFGPTSGGAAHPWIDFTFGDPSTLTGWIGQIASHQPLRTWLQQQGLVPGGRYVPPIAFQNSAASFAVDGFANVIANLPVPQ